MIIIIEVVKVFLLRVHVKIYSILNHTYDIDVLSQPVKTVHN